MRRVLVDRARKRRAGKRGGDQLRVAFREDVEGRVQSGDVDLVALDEALAKLAMLDAPQSQILELRYFGGLTVEETAEVLGVSTATVDRRLRLGKAWLRREISGG